MKTLKFIITAFILSAGLGSCAVAHANCTVEQAFVTKWESMKNDPTFRYSADYALETGKQRLEQCLVNEKKFAAQEAHRAKFPPPTIGQVKQETNWGTPISVSRITNTHGVTEIQYYAGGHSLMYSNGILNSIYQR